MADIDLDNVHWEETDDGDYQPLLVPVPIVYPDPSDVLYTAITGGEAGTWYPALVESYENDKTFGVDNTSLTGTYYGEEAPSVPVFTIAVVGAIATFTISSADDGTTNNIYTALADGECVLSGTISGVGSSAITFDPGMRWATVRSELGGWVYAVPQRFSVFATGTPLLHAPAQIFGKRMIDLGYYTDPSEGSDWPVFVSNMPDGSNAPDDLAAVFDTVGVKDGRLMSSENIFHYGVMYELRSSTYEAGWAKACELETAIKTQGITEVDVDSRIYSLENVTQSGQINALGVEPGSKRRFLFTINFLLTLRKEY